MTAVKENQDVYFSSFALLQRESAQNSPSWLRPIREAAMDRFGELGFPTTRLEDWKYTSVASIARTPFQPVQAEASAATAAAVAERFKHLPLADWDCSTLVFVDGHYSPELSSPGSLPAGAKVGSLAAALAGGPTPLEQHLARYAKYENHAFVALNTAFIQDGAYVEIPKNLILAKPIQLLFISRANGQPTVSHPRNLIVVGRGSQVTFIENYVGLERALGSGAAQFRLKPAAANPENGVCFTNAVTEVVASEGAVIDYCKLQEEGERSFHVATLQFQLERSSSLHTHSIALGGTLVREEIITVLGGEGAECLLNGLYSIKGQQHVDNHTTIDHAKPHCGSRELYKGVLDEHSTGVFNGKIIVRKDAQKTDSKQSNKNLLLSEDAVINTKPQLEIYADDVKCTHGATIGQVDQEAIFYMRSRGLGREEARNLLIQAFANDIIDRIKVEPLRARLKLALGARLAKGRMSES